MTPLYSLQKALGWSWRLAKPSDDHGQMYTQSPVTLSSVGKPWFITDGAPQCHEQMSRTNKQWFSIDYKLYNAYGNFTARTRIAMNPWPRRRQRSIIHCIGWYKGHDREHTIAARETSDNVNLYWKFVNLCQSRNVPADSRSRVGWRLLTADLKLKEGAKASVNSH